MQLMKITCLDEGDTLVEALYQGHNHNALGQYVQVQIALRTKTKISDKTVTELFTADNSTRIPVYSKTTGEPVMVHVGYNKKMVEVEIAVDGEGNPVTTSQEVDDLQSPILVQKTLGEYDYLFSLMFPKSLFGPGKPGAIPVEVMVEAAILRRYGNWPSAKHYE